MNTYVYMYIYIYIYIYISVCEAAEHQVRVYEERPDERMLASYYRESKIMGFPFQVCALYTSFIHQMFVRAC